MRLTTWQWLALAVVIVTLGAVAAFVTFSLAQWLALVSLVWMLAAFGYDIDELYGEGS